MSPFANFSGVEGALVGLALTAYVIVRQFSTRRVASLWMFIPPIALLYFGAGGLAHLDTTGWVLLSVNLALGAALGFARATTFRIWLDAQGDALMKGTRLTILFWAATIAIKIVLAIVEQKSGLAVPASSNAELMIPAAATLVVQNIFVFLRAQDRRLVAAI